MTQATFHRFGATVAGAQTKLADFHPDRCPYCGDEIVSRQTHYLEAHPEIVEHRLQSRTQDADPALDEPDTPLTFNTGDEDDPGPDDRPHDSFGEGDWTGEETLYRCENCNRPLSRDYVRVWREDDSSTTIDGCYNCRSRSQRY